MLLVRIFYHGNRNRTITHSTHFPAQTLQKVSNIQSCSPLTPHLSHISPTTLTSWLMSFFLHPLSAQFSPLFSSPSSDVSALNPPRHLFWADLLFFPSQLLYMLPVHALHPAPAPPPHTHTLTYTLCPPHTYYLLKKKENSAQQGMVAHTSNAKHWERLAWAAQGTANSNKRQDSQVPFQGKN